jgi:hypothetical protein
VSSVQPSRKCKPYANANWQKALTRASDRQSGCTQYGQAR